MRFKPRFPVVAFLVVVLATLEVPARADTIRIVGFGDSLTAGYRLDPGDSFTGRLEAALRQRGYSVEIANAGVSGDTSADGLARLDWSVPDGTDLVILELGANDALRGLAPDITRANLEAILIRLRERGIPVLLAGILAPPNMGRWYQAAFDRIFPELAQQHDVPLYPFFLDGLVGRPDLHLEDGMHPNPAGVERIVDGILPLVVETIEQLDGTG